MSEQVPTGPPLCCKCHREFDSAELTGWITDGRTWWHGDCDWKPIQPSPLDPEISGCASGIALLYMGADARADDYTQRLMVAMQAGDVDEVEHVTALMIVMMNRRGDNQTVFCSEQWSKTFGRSR